MSMPANEIIKKAMARCGLSKNSVLDPFNTTDQMINEFVDAANSLLADLATDNEFSTLLKECDFYTYKTWSGPVTMQKGESRISMYNGKLTRFRAQNTGESEFAPQGEGIFTMNPNPSWVQNLSVSLHH